MSDKQQEEHNKEFVRAHFEEFVNRKNTAAILKNTTEDYYDHDGPGSRPTNAVGDKAMMEVLYDKYPDLQVTIEEMIAEGDRVACRNTWRGTERETGKRIEFHGFVLWRLAGGKIAERWATVTQPREEVVGSRW